MADYKRKPARSNQRMRGVEEPRRVAYEALLAVDQDGAYANLVLPPMITRARLSHRDASLATELVYGTLRYRGRIDWVLGQCMNRPIDKIDPEVRAILRMTAHQILHMRIPDHASVAEAVELTKQVAGRGVEKFVNGVARAVSDHTGTQWEKRMARIQDDAERITVMYSHPQWIVRALATALQAHGRDPRELEDLLAVNNSNPDVSLCARPGLILPVDLADDAEYFLKTSARPGDYSEWAVMIGGGDPGRLHAIRDGRAAVQDEGSQLVATAFAELEIETEDTDWLDMSAGPGGKAGLVAAIGAQRGAHLLANEVSEHRARLVENTVRQLDNVTVQVGDGRNLEEGVKYDRIILDAPCTGLGALRRRAESRWRRTVSDLTHLVKLQEELIDSGLDALKPGGVMAYITCSPHKRETIDQIERIKDRDDIEILSAAQAVDQVSMSPIELTPVKMGGGDVIQLWPHVHQTDAMFLALVRKVK
ncbi:MAG: transcription antitermination factor NusB [Actinomycetaceae bacterium]|nr:transcription antitermination factor NusB [Actinomycetaceae bacterium]